MEKLTYNQKVMLLAVKDGAWWRDVLETRRQCLLSDRSDTAIEAIYRLLAPVQDPARDRASEYEAKRRRVGKGWITREKKLHGGRMEWYYTLTDLGREIHQQFLPTHTDKEYEKLVEELVATGLVTSRDRATFLAAQGLAVRDGQFLHAGGNSFRGRVRYIPFGDQRDAEIFAKETNQEKRRWVLAACGERVLNLKDEDLIQADDYGKLYRTGLGVNVVRVVCPSTAAVYLLPVPRFVQTAKAAVASTFGLTEVEYSPTFES
jgi:DNA-binding MarR family transcriptional regulator